MGSLVLIGISALFWGIIGCLPKIEVRFYWGLKQAFPKKKQTKPPTSQPPLNLVVLSQEMITIVMKVCNDFRYGQSVQLSSSQSFDLTREFLGDR